MSCFVWILETVPLQSLQHCPTGGGSGWEQGTEQTSSWHVTRPSWQRKMSNRMFLGNTKFSSPHRYRACMDYSAFALSFCGSLYDLLFHISLYSLAIWNIHSLTKDTNALRGAQNGQQEPSRYNRSSHDSWGHGLWVHVTVPFYDSVHSHDATNHSRRTASGQNSPDMCNCCIHHQDSQT